MIRFTVITGIASLFALASGAAADVEKGRQVYRQCSGCHAIGPGAGNLFGPQLNGVFERGMGEGSGFDYSQAYQTAVAGGLVWDAQTMDEFLQAPMAYLPGTKMAFPGVKDESDRAALIAWLNSVGVDGVLPDQPKAEPTAAAELESKPRPLAASVPLPEHGVFHLGRVALPEEIAAWDIDIRPDGMGLPPGSGTVEAGVELYDAQCAVCHGDFGEGAGRWPILAGGHGTLTEDRPEKTIGSYWPFLSTVYDYVRRAMPFGNARSLSDDDVYAITAYLLYLNDLVDENFELNSDNFAEVRLPNEDNFIADNRADEPSFKPDGDLCMVNCKPAPVSVTMRARVLDVTPDTEGDNDGAVAID